MTTALRSQKRLTSRSHWYLTEAGQTTRAPRSPRRSASRQAGQITFAVMARATTNEPHRLIATSIGLAIPSDENAYGYLSELHGYGMNDDTAGDYSEDMAAAMLAST